MVEPHSSALEKVLVNPVIDQDGHLGEALSAAANGRARRALTDRPPPAFLKGQAARHEGRRSAPSTTPCWREGTAPNMAAEPCALGCGAVSSGPVAAAFPGTGAPSPRSPTGEGCRPVRVNAASSHQSRRN